MKSIPVLVFALGLMSACAETAEPPSEGDILLKDYRPVSIYNVPVTNVQKAKFPIIDVHSHPYPRSLDDVELWVRNMDSVNVKRTVILTYSVGARFDSLMSVYGKFPDRFEVWCGWDLSDSENPDFSERVVKELERCHEMGGLGIGELHDKGWGMRSGTLTSQIHLNDPKLQPVLKRAGELGLPVSIHVAEPIWMYQPMDSTNDGMMNAYKWRLDNRDDIVDHAGMIHILEDAVKQNPGTTFIANHFANLSYDLAQLGRLFNTYPNLYADISARYAETSPIPRHTRAFYVKYQDRLMYGTDMGYALSMYRTTFRILETADEHFYVPNLFSYHWPLHGLDLPEEVLRKVYHDNAERLFKSIRNK